MWESRQLRLWLAVGSAALLLAGVFVVSRDAVDSPGPSTKATGEAFVLPTAPTPKRVFAHYMPNFPISIDNVEAAHDYYSRELLAPDGEAGKHSAYGGYLRDRPQPRAPLSTADWKVHDLQTEFAQARAAGIDGFAVDVILSRSDSDVISTIMDTAQSADFSILPVADLSGPLRAMTAPAFIDDFADYLLSPAVERLPDGRPVLSAFKPEEKSIAWWRSVLDGLSERLGTSVAFVPILLDANRYFDDFLPLSYGVSAWGGARTPSKTDPQNNSAGSLVELARRAHAAGKIWMAPITFQDSRPSGGTYDEAGNSQTLQNSWRIATETDSEWAQIITWNDYAEGTAFAPSALHGTALLDLNRYFLATFKWGPPTITRDEVFVVYRTQPATATPSYPTSILMTPTSSSDRPRDVIELIAFTTAPAEGRIQVGGQSHTCALSEGLATCAFPLSAGKVAAEIVRDGRVVTRVDSGAVVVARPVIQNLQYVVAGSLR